MIPASDPNQNKCYNSYVYIYIYMNIYIYKYKYVFTLTFKLQEYDLKANVSHV